MVSTLHYELCSVHRHIIFLPYHGRWPLIHAMEEVKSEKNLQHARLFHIIGSSLASFNIYLPNSQFRSLERIPCSHKQDPRSFDEFASWAPAVSFNEDKSSFVAGTRNDWICEANSHLVIVEIDGIFSFFVNRDSVPVREEFLMIRSDWLRSDEEFIGVRKKEKLMRHTSQ